MDNKEKKDFLKRCYQSLIVIRSINEEIETLRSNIMIHAQNNDGMPHGSSQSDLSAYAAKLDEMSTELKNEMDHYWKTRREIISAIEQLPNESEKTVLRLRYINSKKWEDIANEMSYALQHVYRIHGNALVHLQIKKVKDESK